jgi:hypothetical protein
MKKSNDKKLKELQKAIDIQCSDGNWNYDPYMFGLANGLLVAKAILTESDVALLTAPDHWLFMPVFEWIPEEEKSFDKFVKKHPLVQRLFKKGENRC